MGNALQHSERELERPDWKQWTPIYGIYEIRRANATNRPAINDEESSPITYYGGFVYHGVAASALGLAVLHGLAQLVEKIF